MNSHTLRITGMAELPESLGMKNYIVSINGDIVKISKSDNDDGSFTFSYSLKQNTCEILKEGGKVIKTKDKRKESYKDRLQLLVIHQEQGIGEEFEEWYSKVKPLIRKHIPDILIKEGIIK